MNLTGKRVLITAAGQGIGFSTAKLFAEAGAQVIATDINTEQLQGLPGIEPMTLNVTDAAAIGQRRKALVRSTCCSTAPAWYTADQSWSAVRISGHLRWI